MPDAVQGTTWCLLKKLGFNVFGVDVSEDAVNYCTSNRLLNQVRVASITKIPYPDEEFDLIYSFDVLTVTTAEETEKSRGGRCIDVLSLRGIFF